MEGGQGLPEGTGAVDAALDDGVMADGDALSPLTNASAGNDEWGGCGRGRAGGARRRGACPCRRRCRRECRWHGGADHGGGARRRSAAGAPGCCWWCLPCRRVLSLRLVRADTAFDDEATSLWAGHLEWAHWLHGTPIPQFPKYFSGAPVIYPPLGALADSLGGLAAARLLSLLFMLGATALLWGTTGRLYGRRAALFAAALFAVLGPTLHLGAFATDDALRVVLVALAAWCVVRAGDRGRGTGWMVAAGTALAVANAAAYSSVLFDLVRARACAADRVAVRGEAGGPAVRDLADHRGGAAGGRGAHRRERLSRRV